MRMTAFETYLRRNLPEKLSIKRLAQEVGICRQTIYRRFLRAPWREGRGSFEGRLFTRLAIVLMGDGRLSPSQLDRERNVLLWLSGFNPFVERGLSSEDMQDLYETVESRVSELALQRGESRGA